jgi:hypothetical protein
MAHKLFLLQKVIIDLPHYKCLVIKLRHGRNLFLKFTLTVFCFFFKKLEPVLSQRDTTAYSSILQELGNVTKRASPSPTFTIT